MPSLPRPQQDPSQGSFMPRKNLGPHSAKFEILSLSLKLDAMIAPNCDFVNGGLGEFK
jgi:hypothetical protein